MVRNGVWVQAALFFLLVEAEPEDTTASLARRLALIVLLQFSAGEAGPKRLVTLQTLARFQAQQKQGSKPSSEQAECKLSKHFDH